MSPCKPGMFYAIPGFIECHREISVHYSVYCMKKSWEFNGHKTQGLRLSLPTTDFLARWLLISLSALNNVIFIALLLEIAKLKGNNLVMKSLSFSGYNYG